MGGRPPDRLGVPCQCPLPQPDVEGVEILDKVGLHKGGAHPQAGRTCGLWSRVPTCQPPSHASGLSPLGRSRKGRRPPGNLVAGHTQDGAPPPPRRPSRANPPAQPCPPPPPPPGPAGPQGREKNAAAWRLPGPGGPQPVLKRQGGCRACLGRLPGMGTPGLEAAPGPLGPCPQVHTESWAGRAPPCTWEPVLALAPQGWAVKKDPHPGHPERRLGWVPITCSQRCPDAD